MCIFPHPWKVERTNSAAVVKVYHLLRSRHLSFSRLSSVIVVFSGFRTRLTNCARYFLSYPIPQQSPMHSSVNSIWWTRLFTLFDLGAHAFWKWTSNTKIWFNEVSTARFRLLRHMLTYHSLTIVDTWSHFHHTRLALDRLADCPNAYRNTPIVDIANDVRCRVSATPTLLPWMLYDDLLIRCVLTEYILKKNIISPWRTDTSSSLIINLEARKLLWLTCHLQSDYFFI